MQCGMQCVTSQSDVNLFWVIGTAVPGQRSLCERQVIAAQLELVEIHSHWRLDRCHSSRQWQCLACGQAYGDLHK